MTTPDTTLNLSELTRQQLVELIQKASAELAHRMNEPAIERIKHVEPVRVLRVLREPPGDDKDFVLAMRALLVKGSYAKAAERERVAQIAREYPEWVAQQQVPKSGRAGDWRRAAEFYSMGRAKER